MNFGVYRYKGVEQPEIFFVETEEELNAELAKGDCMDCSHWNYSDLPEHEPDWKPEPKKAVTKQPEKAPTKQTAAKKTPAKKAATSKASAK